MKYPFRLFCLILLTLSVCAEPFLVAHRGYPTKAPENTVIAYQLAWENGANAAESDYRLTKDGVVVCSHDGNLKRATGVDFEIADHSCNELRKINFGAKYGSGYANVHVPTLAEMAATIPAGKQFIVELKFGREIVEPMAKVLKESGLKDEQIRVISFQTDPIKVSKELYPEWKTYWIHPMSKDEIADEYLERTLAKLKEIKADGFTVRDDKRLTPDFFKKVHEADTWVDVWVINDPVRAKEIFEMGADSVTTDKIGEMRRALAENPPRK